MILDNAIGDAAFDHEVRHVGIGGVDEAADDGVVAVQFGDGFELILVQEALLQHVVALFADAPVLAVDQVVDDGAVGQDDLPQVAQYVVVVAGRRGADGLGFQFAIGGVVIGGVVVVEQPVLGVVVGDGCAVQVGAVAVVVVAVAGLYGAIQFHFDQPPCHIVSVIEGAGAAAYGFYFLGNPAQFVAAEIGLVQVCRCVLRQITGDFAEAVVGIAIGQAAERGAGQQAVLGVAGQGQVDAQGGAFNGCQQAVVVVLVGERVGAVDADGADAEVVVVGFADVAAHGSRPAGLGR